MTTPDQTLLMEALSLRSHLPLDEFCGRFQSALELPEFEFDAENDNEWCFLRIDHLEYNISRPYEEGKLQEWNTAVPAGCNVGILLILYRGHGHPEHDWAMEHLVAPVAQVVANEFLVPVYYHYTWLGPGKGVPRAQTYMPVDR